MKGKDVITSPKTKKSNRTIQMPDFLCEEMQEFFKMQYGLKRKTVSSPSTRAICTGKWTEGQKPQGSSVSESTI